MTEIRLTNEDQIKNIYEKIIQLKSNITVMLCATTNEYQQPNITDMQNSLYIIDEFIANLSEDVKSYMKYLEDNKLYEK